MVIKDIRAGDTYKVEFSADYDSAVFTPKLLLNNSTNKYEKVGSGDFEITITAAESAAFVPGHYAYSLVVFGNDEQYTIESGFVSIVPNIADTGVDMRTQNQRTLDAIKATIEGVADVGQQQMTINGKSISRYSIDELLKLHDKYARLVKHDENVKRFGSGNRKIFIRF